MFTLHKWGARWGAAAAFAALACSAQAALLDNHVVVGAPYYGRPSTNHDQTYSLRLGDAASRIPAVTVYVDNALGKASFATVSAAPAYLTYVQNVNIVQVQAGDEISARTLSDGSLPSLFKATAISSPVGQTITGQPITSTTGRDTELYLGFAYNDPNTSSEANLHFNYGWMHLHYDQLKGLSLVSSAMTTSDAGIYALTRNTIASSVDEASSSSLMGLGLAGLVGGAVSRRRAQARAQRAVNVRQ